MLCYKIENIYYIYHLKYINVLFDFLGEECSIPGGRAVYVFVERKGQKMLMNNICEIFSN